MFALSAHLWLQVIAGKGKCYSKLCATQNGSCFHTCFGENHHFNDVGGTKISIQIKIPIKFIHLDILAL